jgi:P27 family predicted phage terminase small subunit
MKFQKGGKRMARPRQPVDLLVYKGKKNLTKQEIEDRKSQEVKAASDKVKAPIYLPKDLKREFKKIADELLKIGIISNLDINSLVQYLEAYAEYRFLESKITEIKNEEEFDLPLYEKYSKLINDIRKQCRGFASDLGLTISSRCRLVIPKEDKKPPSTEAERRFGDRI